MLKIWVNIYHLNVCIVSDYGEWQSCIMNYQQFQFTRKLKICDPKFNYSEWIPFVHNYYGAFKFCMEPFQSIWCKLTVVDVCLMADIWKYYKYQRCRFYINKNLKVLVMLYSDIVNNVLLLLLWFPKFHCIILYQ